MRATRIARIARIARTPLARTPLIGARTPLPASTRYARAPPRNPRIAAPTTAGNCINYDAPFAVCAPPQQRRTTAEAA